MSDLQQTGYEKCQEAIALKDVIVEGMLRLGERLKEIREKKYFQPVHESFWQFCEEDMHFSESKASRLISIFEKFILEWNISPAKVLSLDSWSDAYKISLVARDKDHAESLLEMVPSELKKELVDLKVGEHSHQWQEIRIRQCLKCGAKEKIE